jgi:hypothetical protein
MTDLAEELAETARARVERLIAAIYPAGLLVFGACIFLALDVLMRFFAEIRSGIMAGGSPW